MNCNSCGNPLKPDLKFCPACGVPVPVHDYEMSDEDHRIKAIEKALGYKYKVVGRIGAGGFADVYLGEHTQLGRQVAIKILIRAHAAEGDMVERFRRESKAAAKLSHPNIIDIYDVGESGEIYYFVMKYVEGETLARKMQREKKIPPPESIHIIKQVADALAYAHEHEVIHRDIKPANIMLDLYGKPILMDFGIARVQYGGHLTRTGTLMGTPHYLAPEQPLGKPVDGRSDIYSLGVVFYEMLAGRVPFHDETAIALIYKHINEPPPLITNLAPEISQDLAKVVHTMLEKPPENRYKSADELLIALDELSMVYPFRATPGGRRGTPSETRDTEKLLFLAGEHLQQQKVVKAMEIYTTILQRHPGHIEARQKSEEVIENLIHQASEDIAAKRFESARESIALLQRFSPQDPRLLELRADLEREEQRERKQTEFQSHLDAGISALRHDNATMAVEHLTKALTIDPSSPRANELLREARGAYESNKQKAEYANSFAEAEYHFKAGSYDVALAAVKRALDLDQTSEALQLQERIQAAGKEKAYKQTEIRNLGEEVDRLCEELDFEGALKLLDQVQDSFPEFVKTKKQILERNHQLHQQVMKAEDLLENNKLEEALKAYQEFLQVPTPYDFQAFYALRKHSEDALKKIQRRMQDTELGQLLRKADVLLRMGRIDEARQECLKVLSTHPEHQAAQTKLEEIDRLRPDLQTSEELRALLQEVDTHGTREVEAPAAPPPPAASPAPPPATKIPAAPEKIARDSREDTSPMLKEKVATVPVLEKTKSLLPVIIAIGAVAVVVTMVVFFLLPRGTRQPETSPRIQIPSKQARPVTPMAVSIDVQPWANIEISGSGLKEKIFDTTPSIVMLPPGQYSVLCANPAFPSFSQSIEVRPGTTNFRLEFSQLDAEKLVDTFLR